MADLLSHVALAHLVKRLSPWPSHPLLFATGTCLPDLLGRAPGSLASVLDRCCEIPSSPYLAFGIDIFHMPLPYLMTCLFISGFVQEASRRLVFWNLLLGGFLHLLLDFPQEHITGGYRLFFPFSWQTYELACMGTEATVPFAPLFLAAACATEWLYRRRTHPPAQKTP